ncbi:MAG: hypothetical protein ACOWWM_20045 [Desulfobacterales bacterium]
MAEPGDVEVVADAGIIFEPVFVVALESVDAAVTVDKIAAGPDESVIIVQDFDPIIFGQGGAQRFGEFVIFLVPDAQHGGAGVFQLAAKGRIVGREMGREEYDVHSISRATGLESRFRMDRRRLIPGGGAFGPPFIERYTVSSDCKVQNAGRGKSPREEADPISDKRIRLARKSTALMLWSKNPSQVKAWSNGSDSAPAGNHSSQL